MEGTFGPLPAVAVCASIADGLAGFTEFRFEDLANLFSVADLDLLRSLVGLDSCFVRLFFTSLGKRTTLKRLPLTGNESGIASGRNACYCCRVRGISRYSSLAVLFLQHLEDITGLLRCNTRLAFGLPETRTWCLPYRSTIHLGV